MGVCVEMERLEGPAWLHEGKEEDVAVRLAETQPMTKFERTVVIGFRAMQLAQGSRARAVESTGRPLEVAEAELIAGTLPEYEVLRHLPDGTSVRRAVRDMEQLAACVDT